ncbi:MAG: potassium transporter Trk [Myxococcales bacterium]
MRLIIVGGGRLVYFLVRTMLAKGHRVTIIDRDRANCDHLARALDALVLAGDGTDPDLLDEAGAGSADQVLALTPEDHVNLVVCQLALRRFMVPRVVALVNDPDNERVFRKLGIETTFSAIPVLASLIEQRSAFGDLVDLMPVADGRIRVSEVVLPTASPLAGMALAETRLPAGALIGAVVRGDATIVPNGATVLTAGDRLVVIALPESHDRLLRMLGGK